MLELVAGGHSLPETLEELCRLVAEGSELRELIDLCVLRGSHIHTPYAVTDSLDGELWKIVPRR